MAHDISELDLTIHQIERLYHSITGVEAPLGAGPYAPIPPEKNPEQYVGEQLDRLLGALGAERLPQAAMPWTPLVTVWESPNEVIVSADLPGVNKDTLSVRIAQNVLVISGVRHVPNGFGRNGEMRTAVRENCMGPFRRQVMLPPGCQAEPINAQLKDGVLEVRVPRSGIFTGQARAISVHS